MQTSTSNNNQENKFSTLGSSLSMLQNIFVNNSNTNLSQQSSQHDIKLQIYFSGLITVVYISYDQICNGFELGQFRQIIRSACRLDDVAQRGEDEMFTIKWVDEEGDPCTISSQMELEEAIRLFFINKETDLKVHVFPNKPTMPGMQCIGEDRNIYRRGARRWRKIYLVNGHKYQARRFARTALCKVCQDRIWGLGRQGYKCLACKTLVHKRCHKFITSHCDELINEKQGLMNKNYDESNYSLNNYNKSSLEIAQKNSELDRIDVVNKNDLKKQISIPEMPQSLKILHELEEENSINYKNETETDDVEPSKSRSIGLNDFDLIKVIGRGSYAKVFLVRYKKSQKYYAMKIIKKSMINDDEDIDWVQTEKYVFEQATNHPFLVGLHSCFQSESRLFFVIEYLCGGDLMFHMQRKRKLPEEHARFYAAEISIALGFLHSKGIIYRDLKLDNVLIDIEGHIKLTDYGMCKEGLAKGELTGTFCGTPNYISPEMLRGESYGFSVDWWALGVLMHEMIVGRSPFEINESQIENPDLKTEDHLFQVILEKPIRLPRSLSIKAASVLKAFLQKSPNERLGSNGDLGEIEQHAFFTAIDFQLLEQRLVRPPYKPQVADELDLTNIDELFTQEPVVLTPESPRSLANINQNEFEGFEYINPLILSEELQV